MGSKSHFGNGTLKDQIEKSLNLSPYITYLKGLFDQNTSDSDSDINNEPTTNNSIGNNNIGDGHHSIENQLLPQATKASTTSSSSSSTYSSASSVSISMQSNSSSSSSFSDTEDLGLNDEAELNHLLSAHRKWKSANYEFGSPDDLFDLFNHGNNHGHGFGLGLSQEEFEFEEPFELDGILENHDFDSIGLPNRRKPGGLQHNNRSRKQSMNVIRSEEQQQSSSQSLEDSDDEEDEPIERLLPIQKKATKKAPNVKTIEMLNLKRRRIYVLLCKKEIGKTQRSRAGTVKENMNMRRRLAQACTRHQRQKAIQSQRAMKESVWRAKRLTREMGTHWRAADRLEREVRKKREKEAEEQRKYDMEIMEAKRQQRKLNFLITQTELYAHFMSKKLGNKDGEENILNQLDEEANEKNSRLAKIDDYDSEAMKALAKSNVEKAFKSQQSQVKVFDMDVMYKEDFKSDLKLDSEGIELNQPDMFEGVLKHYQLKGMNWLVNLFDQGINGILADEMGLGKTVQSIAFLSHIAESYTIWGPFLVIAPASTLHNWQQEFLRFTPKFKVVPYWGNPSERKILRQFWNTSGIHTPNATFHIVITSYQIVVADLKYFNRVKWQYLILDEAQAIKSTASTRWKLLLGFSCRNRLLLTGTPIQNTMGELWALLHFIMPSLFDSHEEFSEWFSKDIESHAENPKSYIDEKHLCRLHLILKPFMLRRIKKDVENELSDKIEVLLYCPLTVRQRQLYTLLKKKIRIEDLIISNSNSNLVQQSTTNLMNLVMQFRKVCNHPDLFERREVCSPLFLPKIELHLPKLFWTDNILHYNGSSVQDRFNIFHPSNKTEFFFQKSFNMSEGDIFNVATGGVYTRWKFHNDMLGRKSMKRHWKLCSDIDPGFLLIEPDLTHYTITSYDSPFYEFLTDTIYSMAETIEHRSLRSKKIFQEKSQELTLLPEITHDPRTPEVRKMQPGYMPLHLCYMCPTSLSLGFDVHISDRGAAWWLKESRKMTNKLEFNEVSPVHGWSNLIIPDKEKLITDSGKLTVLDNLLKRLKAEGHRVLIYSQMTRMIDLLEEVMVARKWIYIRLDGSSKIAERRDMVADFQSRSDIFVFLLSTRAGGLGINLTAADTVVFYDSDWNPTVDQQAMDRAHRLGQTKQVTVYRLVTKSSIEERILQRAREKNEIQRMVISGGNLKSDTLKPKEVVSLLLDDEELERKYRQKQAERKLFVEDKPISGIKRKIASPAKSPAGAVSPLSQPTIAKKIKSETESSEVVEDPLPCSSQDCASPGQSAAFVEDYPKNLEEELEELEEEEDESKMEWEDFDEEIFPSIKRPRLTRGTGKRGRPPSRIRLPNRDYEGDSASRRGPGRPRLRPIGPANQGIRGRRPGRPPLTKKPESTTLTPLTPSQRVFGFYSSPDLEFD